MDTTILIVEDEKNINDILSYTFTQSGYKTLSAYDGVSGLEMCLNEKFFYTVNFFNMIKQLFPAIEKPLLTISHPIREKPTFSAICTQSSIRL